MLFGRTRPRRQAWKWAPIELLQGGVAGSQKRTRVNASRDRPNVRPPGTSRLTWAPTARVRSGRSVARSAGCGAAPAGRTARSGRPCGHFTVETPLVWVAQLVIGGVDLSHGVVGPLLHDRIAARDVGVMLPRKTPPRRLDGVGGCVERQFQDGERVSRHPTSLPARLVWPVESLSHTFAASGA
jgi:hypothetical protein